MGSEWDCVGVGMGVGNGSKDGKGSGGGEEKEGEQENRKRARREEEEQEKQKGFFTSKAAASPDASEPPCTRMVVPPRRAWCSRGEPLSGEPLMRRI